MGAEPDLDSPHRRGAQRSAGAVELLGRGGAAARDLDQLGGVRSEADLPSLGSNPAQPITYEPPTPGLCTSNPSSLLLPPTSPFLTPLPLPEPSLLSKSPFLRPLSPHQGSWKIQARDLGPQSSPQIIASTPTFSGSPRTKGSPSPAGLTEVHSSQTHGKSCSGITLVLLALCTC